MGNFMTDVGKVNIPEDRKDAYIRDAKAVLKQSGLFERSYTQTFGHDVFLLSFPTFTGDYADFNYSYYEQRAWENAGIDLENCKPYSNKIGGRQFNLAIQALYALTEIYSDTLYTVVNDTLNTPVFSLFWLRYVLNRDDIQFTWRNTSIWDIYESMSLSSTYYPKRNTPKEFFNTLCGDVIDYNQLMDIQIVMGGAKRMLDLADKEGSAESRPFSLHFLIKRYYDRITEYKESSETDEKEQLDSLLNIVCLDIEYHVLKTDEHGELTSFSLTKFLSPKIRVKIISEIYNKDFWELWNQVKNKLPPDFKPMLIYDIKTFGEHEVLSTEEYFNIDSYDRLYWWTDCGDVKISGEMQKWFDALSARFTEILASFDSSESVSVKSCQKRLAALAEQKHHDVYFFEDMFYEFFGSFTDAKYRAWLMLLEEYSNDKQYYRQLHAVLANTELRKKVFNM